MKFPNQEAVDRMNERLKELQDAMEGIGNVRRVNFDFIEVPPAGGCCVDKHGEFVLNVNVSLSFLVYEKTIEQDVVAGVRDAANSLSDEYRRLLRKVAAA